VFERFTDRARRVLVLAQEEARLLNHTFIGTEHILLGLIGEGEGVAARVLGTLDVSLDAARVMVEEIIGRASTGLSNAPPFTPRAKKVLELALRESLQRGDDYIGTEHILLGILREGEGVGATVLVNLGADLGRVRQATVSVMEGAALPPRAPGLLRRTTTLGFGPSWEAPAWDRPSEGTVPAVLPVDALVLQNDLAAVALEHLEVYPNGFVIKLVVVVNPRQAAEALGMLRTGLPEVTVRFSDGKTASVGPRTPDLQKDEEGFPTEPIVGVSGRLDGTGREDVVAWVFPLPPAGPLEILVSLEALGVHHARVVVDGSAVRAAAERARVVWR
jgi:Clp amino terminal domain, pathogenicity island component